MTRVHRKVVALTAAIVASAALASPHSASAASAADDQISTPSPVAAGEASGDPGDTSGRARLIRCVLSSDNPHRSHTPGKTNQINYHPRVRCTEGGVVRHVPYIGLSARMLRGDNQHGPLKTFTARNRGFLEANAQRRCADTNRRYQGIAGATVHMPPNYVPSVVRLQARSSVKTLNCRS